MHGFDVLAITDHTTRHHHVQASSFGDDLAEIELEGRRARMLYGMLVLPGLELTADAPEPEAAGHALAIGLRTFVGIGGGPRGSSARGARAGAGARRRPPVHAVLDYLRGARPAYLV